MTTVISKTTKAKLTVTQLAPTAKHWFTAVAPVSLAVPKGATPRPAVAIRTTAAKTLYVGSLNAGAS